MWCTDVTWQPGLLLPSNTSKRWLNVGLTLGQRRRRWPNVNATLGSSLGFAGNSFRSINDTERGSFILLFQISLIHSWRELKRPDWFSKRYLSPPPDKLFHLKCWSIRSLLSLKVPPPQIPVSLKHVYIANFLRAEFTVFFPTYAPMWCTITKRKLSFFKNRSENGMLTCTVLSLWVKRSTFPGSLHILTLIPREDTHPSHPLYLPENSIPQLYLTSHIKKTMCAFILATKLQHHYIF